MSYLVATNVVSEVVRARPHPKVVEWFRGVPDSALHLSVLTLGELRQGVERVAAGFSPSTPRWPTGGAACWPRWGARSR